MLETGLAILNLNFCQKSARISEYSILSHCIELRLHCVERFFAPQSSSAGHECECLSL